MIHTIHTMNLRRYAVLDKDDNIKLVRRAYNPFPVGWFDSDGFFNDVKEILGGRDVNYDKDAYNMLSYNRILILDSCYKAIAILMESQNISTLFTTILSLKPMQQETNIKYYIQKVKDLTGIEIKDGHDLKKLAKEIERRYDKYQENTTSKKPMVKHDFIDIVENVFQIVEQPLNMELTLFEFGALKREADRKIKKMNSNGAR